MSFKQTKRKRATAKGHSKLTTDYYESYFRLIPYGSPHTIDLIHFFVLIGCRKITRHWLERLSPQ
jgi:hypothetical protein